MTKIFDKLDFFYIKIAFILLAFAGCVILISGAVAGQDILFDWGGNELLTNGDFDGSSTGWGLYGTATYSSNAITFTGDGASDANKLIQGSISGAKNDVVYLLSYNVKENSLVGSGSLFESVVGTNVIMTGETTLPINSGINSLVFTSKSTGTANTFAFIVKDSATSGTLTIDDISLIELDVNHYLSLNNSNLVSNGDFSSGSTGWNVQAGWTIADGFAQASSSTSDLSQAISDFASGEEYAVSFIISDYVGGSVRPFVGSTSGGSLYSSNGFFTETIAFNGVSSLYFDAITSFTANITDVNIIDDSESLVSLTGLSPSFNDDLLSSASVVSEGGAVYGSPVFSSSGVAFDGVNDRILYPSMSNFGSDSGKLSLRFNLTTGEDDGIVIHHGAGTGDYIVAVGEVAFVGGSAKRLKFWADNNFRVETSFDVDDGVTREYFITSDGTNSKIYVDGVLDTTGGTSTVFNSDESLNIGGDSARWLNGTVGFFSIYDYALTADEVSYFSGGVSP